MVNMDFRLERNSTKLKFGIDALLFSDRASDSPDNNQSKIAATSDEERAAAKTTVLNISKPLPQMVVPCSDCVSSMFGCCRLGPTGNCARDNLPGLSRYLESHHVTYNGAPGSNGGTIYGLQPIRPFATRPAMRIPMTHSSSSPPSGLSSGGGGTSKRKRSWSRAVFSNLQRKGLERRFQIQKYITKPDRRQLAATLGLTDAQVKVWFQNRRMKWRHSTLKSGEGAVDSTQEEDIQIDVDTIQDDM